MDDRVQEFKTDDGYLTMVHEGHSRLTLVHQTPDSISFRFVHPIGAHDVYGPGQRRERVESAMNAIEEALNARVEALNAPE